MMRKRDSRAAMTADLHWLGVGVAWGVVNVVLITIVVAIVVDPTSVWVSGAMVLIITTVAGLVLGWPLSLLGERLSAGLPLWASPLLFAVAGAVGGIALATVIGPSGGWSGVVAAATITVALGAPAAAIGRIVTATVEYRRGVAARRVQVQIEGVN